MPSEVPCKACGSSEASVIESRLCNNGTRRRRYCCPSCGFRWTDWDGPRPTQNRRKGERSISANRKRQTTQEEIRLILLAPAGVTNAQLGREMNFSPEWVRRIRTGLSCEGVHPELRRRRPFSYGKKGRSCYDCFHWNPGCDFGFPDPYTEGPGYAQDCDLFKLKES